MMLARLVPAVTLGVALSGGVYVSGQSQAGSASSPKALSRVTKLDITSRRPAFGGKAFGTAGAYEILMGTAHAVADPKAALNAGIVDIDKAPRNAAGLVEYSFDVQILKPVDIGKGNGTLLYEINNRSNRPLYGYWDEGGRATRPTMPATVPRTRYTYVATAGCTARGESSSLWAFCRRLEQRPADYRNGDGRMDGTRHRAFASCRIRRDARSVEGDARIASTRTMPGKRCRRRSGRMPTTRRSSSRRPRADAGTIYEFVCEAKDSVVEGLGFAGMRDFVSFMRHSRRRDGHGQPLFVNGQPALRSPWPGASRAAAWSGLYLSGLQRGYGGAQVLKP